MKRPEAARARRPAGGGARPRAALSALARAGAAAPRDGAGALPGAPVVLVSDRHAARRPPPALRLREGRDAGARRARREASLFENAYSHCPLTLPSHASLLTGLLPPAPRRARQPRLRARAASSGTLAAPLPRRGLRDRGRRLRLRAARAPPASAEGFDATTTRSTSDAARRGRSASSSATAPSRRVARSAGSTRSAAAASSPSSTSTSRTRPTLRPRLPRALADPYDGEVAYADELVGRFLDGLRERGVLRPGGHRRDSDHGEGLGDHGEQEHGFFLYREACRCRSSCACRAARAAGTARRKARSASSDVAATLLDLAGLPADGMDGARCARRSAAARARGPARLRRDLLPALPLRVERAHRGERRPLPAHPRPAAGALRREDATPRETRNLARRAAAGARRDGRLARASARAGEALAAVGRLAEATRERLAALGYVGGGRRAAAAGRARSPTRRTSSPCTRALPARARAARGRAGDEARSPTCGPCSRTARG